MSDRNHAANVAASGFEPDAGGTPAFYDEDDAPVRLRDYGPEDYLSFVVFWVLATTVFVQFFSRYVLNNSVAWTEEAARYLLIVITFWGSVIAVRKNSHIMVEFFYRYIPHGSGRVLSTLVDVTRIVFFAWGTWLAWQVTNLVQNQRMTALPISKSWIYGAVIVGFVGMTARSIQVALRHWRQGYSELDRTAAPLRTD